MAPHKSKKKRARSTARGTSERDAQIPWATRAMDKLSSRESPWVKWLPVIVALSFAAIMLPIALHYHRIGDHGVETDFYGGLVQEGQQFARGEIPIGRFKGPVYGLALAAASFPVGDFFTAAVILSVLSAALVLFLTAKTLLRLFGPMPMLLTVLGMAVNTQFVKYSYTASTDMLFNLWMVASAYVVLRREEPGRGGLLLAGLLAGLAYLTRYAGVALLCWAPLAILMVLGRRLSWRRWLVMTGLFMAGALAVIVPWAAYCKLRAGSFVVNDNYLNIAYGIYADNRTNWDAFWKRENGNFRSLVDVVTRDPGQFFRTIAANLLIHPFYDIGFKANDPNSTVKLPTAILSLMHPVMGVLAPPGVIVWILARPDRRQIAYFALGVSYLVLLLTVFYGSRFSLFLVPMYALLAALFLLRIPWRRLGAIGAPARVVIVMGILLFVALNTGTVIRGDIGSGPKVVLEMRDALRAERVPIEEGSVLVARKPHIAYYLKMEYRTFPDVATVPELMGELHRINARYLYYGPNEWLLRSQFRFLLDPKQAPEGLIPVISFGISSSDEPAVLYEVEPTDGPPL